MFLGNGWSYDPETHIYRIGDRIVPGSTDILKSAGFQYPPGNMDMGRAVHMATEFDDKGILDPASVSDEVYPYLLAWRKFREDFDFKPERIEEPNVNLMLSFGAVLDREGTIKGIKSRALIEIKKYEPPYFTGMQLSLQDLTLPKASTPRIRMAVHLKSDGTYIPHEYKNPVERNLSLALVSLYWYRKNQE